MRSLALHGQAGIGKTEIAIRYADKFKRKYSAIFIFVPEISKYSDMIIARFSSQSLLKPESLKTYQL